MYIGSTGPRGLHHLVYEVVDNSVDEAIAGHCDQVSVTLHPDNSVTVADDGRGIPVEEHEKEKRPAAEVVMTTLHAGGKFGDGGGYKVSGGLHGVGVSVVNALSERLHLEVRRDGYKWTQDYVRGDPQGALKRGEKVKGTGTIITFLPDGEVFEDVVLDYQTLSERLRETAFLTRNLRIDLIDERGSGQHDTFQYKGGIVDFVGHLNENKDALHRKTVFFENETEDGQVEVAMQWNSSYQESVFSFANNINTHEGGAHLSGFRAALTRTLNAYARQKGLLKEKDENLTGDDVREGLTAVISVKLQRPAVRGPDQDQARQPAGRGPGQGDRQPQAGRVPGGEPGRGAAHPPEGCGRRPRPRRGAQGPRPDPAQVGARELDPARQARRLLGARSRRSPSCSSSRATRPAARRSRPAIATRRPCCRCAARSSTSRRAASTRCSRTSRSRR